VLVLVGQGWDVLSLGHCTRISDNGGWRQGVLTVPVSFPSPALCSLSGAAPLLAVPEGRMPPRSTSSLSGMDMSSSRGSSSSDSDSGVGGFLVVALRFDALVLDEPRSIATGRGRDRVAGAAALALAPLFGLTGAGAVDRVLLRKGLFIGNAGFPVIAYLGGI
jgi:hypothetical protein